MVSQYPDHSGTSASRPHRVVRRALSSATAFRTVIVWSCAIIAISACSRPKFDGVAFDPPEPAPAVQLTRANGTPFEFAHANGAITVLFFGFTHCPDLCPLTLAEWAKAKRALGSAADRVRFVFISVDPARDTPAIAQQYASQFDASFIGLSGDSASVARVEQAFHVSSAREEVKSPTDYSMSHAGQAFVIDQHGKLRLLYEPGTPYTYLVADIKRLLAGG